MAGAGSDRVHIVRHYRCWIHLSCVGLSLGFASNSSLSIGQEQMLALAMFASGGQGVVGGGRVVGRDLALAAVAFFRPEVEASLSLAAEAKM
jgi:hypothetical protein